MERLRTVATKIPGPLTIIANELLISKPTLLSEAIMGDFLSRINGEDVAGIVVSIGFVFFAISTVVAICW